MEASERCTDLLEHELLRGVDVINTAVAGYGPDQEYLFYGAEGSRYHPELVVQLFFPENDFSDNLSNSGMNYSKPRYELADGRLQLLPIVEPARQRYGADPEPFSFVKHSRVLWFVSREAEALANGARPRAAAAPTERPGEAPEAGAAWLQAPLFAHRPKGWELATALLGALSESCRRDGAKLLVMLVPPRPLVELGARCRDSEGGLDVARRYRAAGEMCAAAGVACLDPLEGYLAEGVRAAASTTSPTATGTPRATASRRSCWRRVFGRTSYCRPTACRLRRDLEAPRGPVMAAPALVGQSRWWRLAWPVDHTDRAPTIGPGTGDVGPGVAECLPRNWSDHGPSLAPYRLVS